MTRPSLTVLGLTAVLALGAPVTSLAAASPTIAGSDTRPAVRVAGPVHPGHRVFVKREHTTPHDGNHLMRQSVTAADGTQASLVPAPPAGPARSTWQVNFSGFDGTAGTQAKAAFTAAVGVWARIITAPSSLPIVVDAEFADQGDPRYLGSAVANGFVPFSDHNYYPMALANVGAGEDINGTEPEILASFSNDPASDFYFGTDGAPPSGTVDFMSVVLHELGHGLGFAGSMRVGPSGDGEWGFDADGDPRDPIVFDRFAYDAPSGGSLLLSKANGSPELGDALESGSVYWGGPSAVSANGGARPRLYAPSTWEDGSSFSHLNETTYPVGNPNSLMTPGVTSQEAIHSPGPIAVAMLADEGWEASLPTGDTTRPTITSYGMPAFTLGTTAWVKYAGSDAGGILNYDVDLKRAAFNVALPTAWTPLRRNYTKAVASVLAEKGYTYCFRIRARDKAGNESFWSTTRCLALPLDDPQLTPSAGWGRGSSANYFLTTYSTAARTGVTLTRAGVRAKQLSAVITSCPGCGTVDVYWNGKLLRRLALTASTTTNKRLVQLASFTSEQTGTLVFKTVDASRVYVDGLGISHV